MRKSRGRRSFGAQSALGRSPKSPDAVIIGLVDRVTRRMRAAGRVGRTVALRLRFADFSRATRSRTLSRPTAATRPILNAVREMLPAALPAIADGGVTLLGVTVTNLDGHAPPEQLTLPFDAGDGRALDSVIDHVRDRFGSDAVTRAAQLGHWEP